MTRSAPLRASVRRSAVDWDRWFAIHCEQDRDMSAGGRHSNAITEFLATARQLCHERGWSDAYLNREQFFVYDRDDLEAWVSPDAYVLDRTPPRPHPDVWRTWEPGVGVPRFALEVVSPNTVAKDY